MAAELHSASVDVAGDGATSVIAIALDVDFRVGAHAEGVREFIVPRAELYVAELPVVQINLERPLGFDGALAPGEHERVRITGMSARGAFPDARTPLCAPGSQVQVLLRWEDRTRMEFGTIDGLASEVSCF